VFVVVTAVRDHEPCKTKILISLLTWESPKNHVLNKSRFPHGKVHFEGVISNFPCTRPYRVWVDQLLMQSGVMLNFSFL